jgi:hypothetical protein
MHFAEYKEQQHSKKQEFFVPPRVFTVKRHKLFQPIFLAIALDFDLIYRGKTMAIGIIYLYLEIMPTIQNIEKFVFLKSKEAMGSRVESNFVVRFVCTNFQIII